MLKINFSDKFQLDFLWIVTLLLCLSFKAAGQHNGNLIIQNYYRNDYSASISNWDVTQDKRGLIMVANYDGIITFDSRQWQYTPIKDNLIAFSITPDSTNRIFAGTQGDFGFLKPDNTGELRYYSLASRLPKNVNIGSFWEIVTTSNGVYFQSPELIVRWFQGNLNYWTAEGDTKFRMLFNVDDTVYTTLHHGGILKIVNNELVSIPNTEFFTEKGVQLIDRFDENTLIITTPEGFFLFEKGEIKETFLFTDTYLKQNQIFTVKKHPGRNNNFIIGTLTGGLASTTNQIQLTTIISKSQGLAGDVVRAVKFDANENLWVALYEGVSHIETSSPLRHWKEPTITGIPGTINRIDDNIYVGSSRGIYKVGPELEKIDEFTSNIWSISSYNSAPLIASQDGLFILNKDHFVEINSFRGVTGIAKYEYRSSSYLIVVHSGGITVLSIQNGEWQEVNNIKLESPTNNSIYFDSNENLWISAKFKGLYKIDEILTTNPRIVKYDTTYGLPDVNEIGIIKKDNNLLFTTGDGFYKFNELTGTFEPDSSIIADRLNINHIAEDKFGNYIISVISEDRTAHVEMLRKEGDKYIRDYIPFRRLPEMEITAIYADGDKYIWIGGSEGLFRFDRTVEKDYSLPFNTLVRKVSVRDSTIFHGNYFDNTDTTGVPPIILNQPDHFKPDLEYENNNLTFEYTGAFYEAPERSVYSYYLKNNDPGWSKWTSDTKKEYNNLSAGTYTFHVKAKNIYDTEGRIASYQFTILPPWYQTFWAYIFFIIIGFLFIWFVALIYSYRVRMQRRRLKLIVADRTYEVINQKKEIERQRDLLQHQYEEICNQRDSIQQKNRKLQAAQNETIYANEALQKLNTHLEKEVEKRTEKIKQTLQQLQNKNKELDTFIYRASHDLKGPISRISGLSTLAKMAVPPDADKSFVELIEVTANNMKVLISKLTQVHDLNNAQIKNEHINIADLLASIRNTLNHLEDESINYTFHFNEDLEVIGDKDLLGIIIQNILENALVFKKPRGLQNNILLEIGSTKESLTLRIYDTGIGILPDQIDRIYDMFYKGANQSIGSGLGLYLVKMTVEKLNGSISVRSKVHEFTEFTVTIPL